ncbi:hypothetical protein FOT62_22920 [Serratia marcescens]|uniref:PEP-utilising enzyme mobile domain-containing protein n=1 Tax=Serratia marcescens TaxID=615 RepID=A0A5C7BT57_SERMA|nr:MULTISPECIES: PEP-utilizing enzyme [Serratia]TXE27170.1 hypothetical protein FOT62_22920 [Serratia marcescens]TXE55273.1 hypothetical protein FOT56_25245 [Serratia marcescens]
MALAFGARCHDQKNKNEGIYTHQEIIYSRDKKGVFHCYIGLKDHVSALKYVSQKIGTLPQPQALEDISPMDSPISSNVDAIAYLRYLSERYCHFIHCYMRSEPIVTDIIERQLALLLSTDRLNTLLNCHDLMHQEQDDLMKVNQDNEEHIIRHIEKYPYLAINHVTRKDLLRSVKVMLANRVNTKIKKVKSSPASLPEGQAAPLINYLLTLSTERMEVKKRWAGTYYYMMGIMEWISDEFAEKQEDLYNYYLLEDIIALIENGVTLTKEEKTKRKNGVLMKRKKDVNLTPEISFGHFFTEHTPEPLYPDEAVLRGTTTIQQKVCGTVKKIDYTELTDVSCYQNKIIVTEMTQPNMITLLRKGKGIITNEGGILSHACIIAREYDIPCIVGTKVATDTLQDGDRIIMWPDGRVSYDKSTPEG